MVRLDDTVTRANLAIVTKTLTELTARKARLSAERDGSERIKFPDELMREADVPDVAQVMAAERKLFDLRRSARAGQKSQLRERIDQANEEIVGLTAQKAAKDKEIELIEHELIGVRELFQKNLVPITRLTQLEREATRLDGERGQLVAATAQAKGKITELQLQIIQIDQDLSSEVAKEMREIDAQDRRIHRAQGHGRRPAQAHRHPLAAGRHRVPVDRAYDRRRHSGRRADHADRARQPTV